MGPRSSTILKVVQFNSCEFNSYVARVNQFQNPCQFDRGVCFGSCPMNRGKDSVLSTLSG